MGVLSAITSFLGIGGGQGQGPVGAIVDAIKSYFPPDMDPAVKAQMELAATQAARDYDLKLMELAAAQDAEFNRRIIEMEGTASDLRAMPLVGPLLIFVRGAQRPVWGFATLWFDWMAFSKQWTPDEKQSTVLMVINALVLGFLFGERAVKNVMPLIGAYFGRKTDGPAA